MEMDKIKKVREKKMKTKQKEAVALKEQRKKVRQIYQEAVTKAGWQRPEHKRNRSTR